MVKRGEEMNCMKRIRIQSGMKQKEVASLTGLSKASISLYESGKGKPSVNSAFKVARALDASVDDLFGWAGDNDAKHTSE